MKSINGKMIRFIIYGLLGMLFEVFWSAIHHRIFGDTDSWDLKGWTFIWMLPIYGLISPLYEPLHNKIRNWFWLFRALMYSAGFMLAEYLTGGIIYLITGHCPWDYSSWTKYYIQGFVRLDIFYVWAIVGMTLEPIHDFLVRLTPAIQRELSHKNKST